MADENIEIASDNPSDSWEGDTYSLSSSVLNYMFENGRRYHGYKEGAYTFPNDEKQNDMMNLVHQMLLARCENKLYFSPIGEPTQVLDVGTGTGIWAISMADTFPTAQITGIDLSPTQPEWVPENIQFLVDDAEDDWLFPENHFDLTYMRMLFGGIRKYGRLLRQALKHSQPGGWVESWEVEHPLFSDDGTLTEDSYIQKWSRLLIEAGKNIGLHYDIAPKLKSWMERAGYVNVNDTVKKYPIGPWAKSKKMKEVGAMTLQSLLDGLEGYSLAMFTRSLGWKSDEVQVFLAQVRQELMNPNVHSYIYIHHVVGQKPMSGDGNLTAPIIPDSLMDKSPNKTYLSDGSSCNTKSN